MSSSDMPKNEFEVLPFRTILEQGMIPLDRLKIPIGINRPEFVELFENFQSRSQEWQSGSDVWTRYNMRLPILWFPATLISFTFCNEILSHVDVSEFSDTSTWDYSIQITRYFRMKEDLIKHFGGNY